MSFRRALVITCHVCHWWFPCWEWRVLGVRPERSDAPRPAPHLPHSCSGLSYGPASAGSSLRSSLSASTKTHRSRHKSDISITKSQALVSDCISKKNVISATGKKKYDRSNVMSASDEMCWTDRKQPVDVACLLLAISPHPGHSLLVISWVPVRIKHNQAISTNQVQATSTSLAAQHEDELWVLGKSRWI